MKIANKINGGRGVMISDKTVLDLEGRCSIQLSYGRSQKDISGWLASAQARLSDGGEPQMRVISSNRPPAQSFQLACVRSPKVASKCFICCRWSSVRSAPRRAFFKVHFARHL